MFNTKKIKIETCPETGRIIEREVAVEQTVGVLMADMGYSGMTLTSDGRALDLSANFDSAGALFPEEGGESHPFGLGLAQQ